MNARSFGLRQPRQDEEGHIEKRAQLFALAQSLQGASFASGQHMPRRDAGFSNQPELRTVIFNDLFGDAPSLPKKPASRPKNLDTADALMQIPLEAYSIRRQGPQS